MHAALRQRCQVWPVCTLAVLLCTLALLMLSSIRRFGRTAASTPVMHRAGYDLHAPCPVAFKNISCAAYTALLEDVGRGSLRACMSDIHTAHHPRQLSGGHQPALIQWDRDCLHRALFAFTSSPEAAQAPPLHSDTYSVFVEMEPPDVTGARPLAQPRFASLFDLVLSLADARGYYQPQPPPPNVVQWPYGSSSIPRHHWTTSSPKPKLCSIIASAKNHTVGHKLRHRVVAMLQTEFAGVCDVYGRGYRAIASKLEGLRDYMFTIVIENSQHGMYMTEKLMDAALTGVVPVYWGSTYANTLFPGGILTWNTLDELRGIMQRLSTAMYNHMKPHLRRNFQAALHYVPPEQWLWEHVMKCVYEWHLAHPPINCSSPPAGAVNKLSVSVLEGVRRGNKERLGGH